MKLLTKENASKIRCFTLTDDSKVWAKMLTATETAKIRAECQAEARNSPERAENMFKVKHLQKSVTNWEGFTDEDGNTIAFDVALIPELYDVNPTVMGTLFSMVSNEFFHISQAEEKNSEAGATAA